MADETGGFDATAYGGKEVGFAPEYNPNTGDYWGSGGGGTDYVSDFLSSMYGGSGPSSPSYETSFSNLDTSSNAAAAEGMGFFEDGWGRKVRDMFEVTPGSKAYGWGLRTPGTTKEQMFNSETPSEKATRLNNVSGVISGIGSMLPGVGMAKGINSAYQGYQKGQPMSTVAGNFLSGMGGIPGAIGAGLQGNYGQAIAKAVPGLGGTVAGLATDAAMGRDVTNPAMTLAGGVLGNQMGGPVGGFVGSKAGGMLADSMQSKPQGTQVATNQNPWSSQTASYTPSQGQQPQGQAPTSIADMFGGTGNTIGQLMGLYNNYQQQQNAEKMASQMQSDIPDLNSMFGPNSAAYARMKQELERKDAASGRRSQYGNRAVDLEARMAQMMGQYAPGVANARSNAQQAALKAQQEGGTRQAQMLNNLFQIGKNTGVNDWIGDKFQGGLSSLFGNNVSEQQPVEVFDPYANYRQSEWT